MSAPSPTDLRARVLRAAVRLIGERGLAELSMREVAREAGVSHQAPYHHFADREAILAAVAQEGFQRLADDIAAARARAPDAVEDLVVAAEAYVRFACEHPAHFRVMFRPDFVDMERFPEAMACGDRAFANLPEIVRRLEAAGVPPLPSETAHVVLYWSVCHGLACLLLDGPLAGKLPEAASAREPLVRDVVGAMRGFVEARLAARSKTPAAKAPAAKARPKRARR